MPWLQLRIVTDPDRAAAAEKALNHHGSLSVTFEDNADQPIFEPELGETPLWAATRITGLFEAKVDSQSIANDIAKRLKCPAESLHWHVLEDKDWEREWMSHYHPIECGEKLWICPSWCEPPDANAVNLKLDPGLAFGTGTHPTTFLCLQWLAEQDVNNLEVVDFGCGSGILGIASLLLGARQVHGVDIDPQALLATRDNIQRNGLAAEQMPVYFPDKAPEQAVDLVLANILAGPLVELAPQLIKLLKPGAKLCLSGILASQKNAIVEAYEHALEFEYSKEKDQWLCLVGKKRA
ncbi:50S ribosomal protein L11 methyltransferase [Agaribacterium haliotis]|uniref:50S ribosomal protein L11 methyltransferase n=1 Tax=Agaribacterium haliotis TaxID=2013869 RepID=UPI000BB54342|nr:50S ribosomal protein L11 methyltransferase [Agaribacterium haliotis]